MHACMYVMYDIRIIPGKNKNQACQPSFLGESLFSFISHCRLVGVSDWRQGWRCTANFPLLEGPMVSEDFQSLIPRENSQKGFCLLDRMSQSEHLSFVVSDVKLLMTLHLTKNQEKGRMFCNSSLFHNIKPAMLMPPWDSLKPFFAARVTRRPLHLPQGGLCPGLWIWPEAWGAAQPRLALLETPSV